MTNISGGQDVSRHVVGGQPELTEDDEGPKSRIRDIEGRAGWSGEEAQGGQGTGREWYDGTVHAVTTALPDESICKMRGA